MRPVRAFALVVVGMLLFSACRIDARVNVLVQDDGSGRVQVRVVLDPEAVRAADTGGATLETRVRLDDLSAAGWRVEPWARLADGSAAVVLRHPFSSPEQLHRVMVDLNGTHGPMRAVRLQRGRDLLRTTFDFRAIADLGGVESGVGSDQELAANLSGQRVDVGGVDAALTAQIRDALRMSIAVALPGAATRVWHFPPGTRRLVETSSSPLDVRRVAWLGAGVVLGATALGLAFGGARKRRRPRRGAEPRGPADTPEGTWPGSS